MQPNGLSLFQGMIIGFVTGLFFFILLYGVYMTLAYLFRPRKKSKRKPFFDHSLVRCIVALGFVVGLFSMLTQKNVGTLLVLSVWGYLFYRWTKNITALGKDFNSGGSASPSSKSSGGFSAHRSSSSTSSSSSSFRGFGGGSSGGGGSTAKW